MKTFQHSKSDTVAVALEESMNIPRFHKIALNDISKGEDVIEYGEIIGHATADIKKGELVHVHNLSTNRW